MPRYLPLNQSTQNNRLANLLALRSTQPQNILTGKAALAPYGQALMGATARIADAIGQRNRQEDLTSTITDAIRAAQGTPAGPAGQAAAAGVLPTAGGLSNAPTPAVAGSTDEALSILAGNPQTAGIALQTGLANALNPKPSYVTKTGAELGIGQPEDVYSVEERSGQTTLLRQQPKTTQRERFRTFDGKQFGLSEGTVVQQNVATGELSILQKPGGGQEFKPTQRIITIPGENGEPNRVEIAANREEANRILKANPGAVVGDLPEGEGAPKSDLVDEAGNVKNEVSATINRQASKLYGGNYNLNTGTFENLTVEDARKAHVVAVAAENLVVSGQARSVGEAVQRAAEAIGLPEAEKPEAQVPPDQRKELLSSNNQLDSILSRADGLGEQLPFAVGAISKGSAGLEATLGQITTLFGRNEPLFPDTANARRALRNFNQDIKRTIINNPRFPKFEQDLVRDMLPDPETWFQNPSEAVQGFAAVLDFVRQKRADNAALLEGRSPLTPYTPDFNSVSTVRAAPLDQVRSFAEGLDENAFNALPEDVRQAIVNRLTGGF